jgi:hypothetical protein
MKIYELLNRIEDDALVTLKIKNEFCYQGPKHTLYNDERYLNKIKFYKDANIINIGLNDMFYGNMSKQTILIEAEMPLCNDSIFLSRGK